MCMMSRICQDNMVINKVIESIKGRKRDQSPMQKKFKYLFRYSLKERRVAPFSIGEGCAVTSPAWGKDEVTEKWENLTKITWAR